MGCVACLPNRGMCDGDTLQRCRPDGSGYDVVETCDASAGLVCNATSVTCSSPCADAEAANSYIGCEYWPVTTLNSQVASDFPFAVVVANPQSSAAQVTVTRGTAMVRTVTVAPGAVQTIELPWVTELKQQFSQTDQIEESTLLRGAAYRLRSSLPVTVYQFNPLEYRIARDCADESPLDDGFGDGQCFSFTNDASLLLPTHALTGNYLVTSVATRHMRITPINFGTEGTPQEGQSPGFLTIVGASDAATEVSITFSAHVRASTDGMVQAFTPGQTGMFTLNAGDVLQLVASRPASCTPFGAADMQGSVLAGRRVEYCTVGAEYDLTGTEIRATGGRVAVYGGHNCAFMPANRWACDHLEEALFPEEAWGREAIVSITQPLMNEPNVVRIMSARDGNMITFDPASTHAAVTLNRGQTVEFEARQSFRVSGTEAISVAQFLVGQNYPGINASIGDVGDPSMSLAIPTDQYRTEYTFLAPSTYVRSFVNVTAPMGATVTLDGTNVLGFLPVGGTGFGVARVEITGGAHTITSSQEFGIVVYGFGQYTSYMYPGGLDLESINEPI
ncbi:Hemagglutinin/hemolysin-related protein [Sandaracinus amylolyticus]|uniref:Hemagglutinin/hemolysin-related protein n=2 Tax=Sandaracinus amylolyticus TaxID=927083 RepID=A0A0F6W426_9BACT|nr:Hemagglutinin/hemolysin-related protein [Sandaracinus amylolyticus]